MADRLIPIKQPTQTRHIHMHTGKATRACPARCMSQDGVKTQIDATCQTPARCAEMRRGIYTVVPAAASAVTDSRPGQRATQARTGAKPFLTSKFRAHAWCPAPRSTAPTSHTVCMAASRQRRHQHQWTLPHLRTRGAAAAPRCCRPRRAEHPAVSAREHLPGLPVNNNPRNFRTCRLQQGCSHTRWSKDCACAACITRRPDRANLTRTWCCAVHVTRPGSTSGETPGRGAHGLAQADCPHQHTRLPSRPLDSVTAAAHSTERTAPSSGGMESRSAVRSTHGTEHARHGARTARSMPGGVREGVGTCCRGACALRVLRALCGRQRRYTGGCSRAKAPRRRSR